MFVSLASSNAESLLLSNQNLLRVEIMAKRQERTRAASMEITPPDSFSLIQVHSRAASADELKPVALAEAASAISAELHFEPALALHTIFPERSRWRLASPLSETELPELGELALIVQFQRIEVLAHYADAFAKAWIDLGYNALGEPGVVRCDLFSVDSPGSATDAPRVFLSRKVFKAAADVTAHERSEHFMAWSARVQSMLGEEGLTGEREELGTVYPLSSPFPFRSRWQTV